MPDALWPLASLAGKGFLGLEQPSMPVTDSDCPTKNSRVVSTVPAAFFLIFPAPSETQECLGAPVLRGPAAEQDERRGAAGADEAASEGAGPGAQEDPEPGREDEPTLVPLPRPHTSWRPRLSMLGGARQAGLGQGAELPRVPTSEPVAPLGSGPTPYIHGSGKQPWDIPPATQAPCGTQSEGVQEAEQE